MRQNTRREPRTVASVGCSLTWKSEEGLTRSATGRVLNRSSLGLGVRCPVELRIGTQIYVSLEDGSVSEPLTVRHCTPTGADFILGFELPKDHFSRASAANDAVINYYEFLQISPNAELPTIQRIYRFLAARFHPDNPNTGDTNQFVLLNEAYATLSDSTNRAEYDAQLKISRPEPLESAASVDFMDGIDGELNRRMAVLSVLYNRRRTNADNPMVSLADLETRLDFPREYLDFATWYLKNKKLITREDNADFSITATGVDYVEENYAKIPVLHRLLLLNSARQAAAAARERTKASAEQFALESGHDEESAPDK